MGSGSLARMCLHYNPTQKNLFNLALQIAFTTYTKV